MADRVRTSSEQGEIFGRNQAIGFLKRALRRFGIRIDLAETFSSGRSYELLSIYFDFSSEEGSLKHFFRPKRDFGKLVENPALLEKFALLPFVQNETFGRNQAIAHLKRGLKRHKIRLNLTEVFEKRRSYELLDLYFDPAEEEGSRKRLFRPKEDFLSRIRNGELLSNFPTLLPKPPAVVRIDVREFRPSEAVVHSGHAFAQLAAC